MLKIAVLVSGGGTNLQALIDAQSRGEIQNGKIHCVLSSRRNAYALQRAEQAGIQTFVAERKAFSSIEAYTAELTRILIENQIDLVVLAGFLTIFGEGLVRQFPHRILNVHPSLIPSFCGKGFYGLKVHEAVLAAGVKVTGATVHFVNEIADGGEIVLQKAISVEQDDVPETLQKRVMEQAEWELLPKAVSLFCEGRIYVKNGKTRIE